MQSLRMAGGVRFASVQNRAPAGGAGPGHRSQRGLSSERDAVAKPVQRTLFKVNRVPQGHGSLPCPKYGVREKEIPRNG